MKKTKKSEAEEYLSFPKRALTWAKNNKSSIIPYFGLVLCLLIFSIVPPILGNGTMWTPIFMDTFINASLTLFIISLGAILIYSMGSMDISVGAMAGVISIVIPVVATASGSIFLGFLVGIIIAVVCAMINATIGEALHLPAVIGSIFLMFFAGGIQTLYFSSHDSVNLPNYYAIFKDPWFQAGFVVVFLALTFYLFKFTKLGKYTRAIGSNVTVARQSGVNVWLYKVLAYSYLGVAVVIASFFSIHRTITATVSTGSSYHMNIMLALILGGMPLSGGMKSRVSAAVIGTIVFNMLDFGLSKCLVPSSMIPFVKAFILFIIIVVTCRKKTTTLQR